MDKNQENTKQINNRKRFSKVLNIAIIVFAVLLLAVEAVVYYQRSYLTPFWVNGQSMYPTLNGNAKDANGNTLNENSGSALAGYIVDYGVMDTHKSAINKIKRFDIIVTKYSKSDTKNKIKRVVGLPGETIYFVNTGINNDHNGDLYINDKLIEQPIDAKFVQSGDYSSCETKITLDKDQYYVLGDNRAHSSDSSDIGPIRKEYITGKVIALCGTAEVYDDGEHLDIKNIDYKWPVKIK